MENQKEIKALIQLIDDPDETIYDHVKEKFLSLGDDVVPILETAWESNEFGLTFQDRIENLIHSIQFKSVGERFSNWKNGKSQDLTEGILLVARYQYPDLDVDWVFEKLDEIEKSIWLELNQNLTALEQVRILNHVFFDVYNFSGNTANYHAPQNSYINNVLESKKGNPISLSIVYSIIAQRLDLPIFGVNLPRHFVLAYQAEPFANIPMKDEASKVLFYINPFSKGGVFSKREVFKFLDQLKLPHEPMFYTPCSNLDIIKRVLNNLINSYNKLGYPEKVTEVTFLLQQISED